MRQIQQIRLINPFLRCKSKIMFVAHKYWVLRILAFDTFICWLCLMIICDRKMKKLNRTQESCHIRKKKQVYETYESGTCWRVELRAYERKELRSYKRSEGRERLKRCSRSKTLFLNRFSLLLLLSIVEIFVIKKTSRKMLKRVAWVVERMQAF